MKIKTKIISKQQYEPGQEIKPEVLERILARLTTEHEDKICNDGLRSCSPGKDCSGR
jgi:hypothetical protein